MTEQNLEDLTRELMKCVESGEEITIRQNIISRIATFRNNTAVETLKEFIERTRNNPQFTIDRGFCYTNLGEIGGSKASEILEDAVFNEPGYNAIFMALDSYVKVNGEVSIPLLHRTLTHDDPYVREETCKFLGEFKDKSVIPLLERELENLTKFGKNYAHTERIEVYHRALTAKALYRITGLEVYKSLYEYGMEIHSKMLFDVKSDIEEHEFFCKFDGEAKKVLSSSRKG